MTLPVWLAKESILQLISFTQSFMWLVLHKLLTLTNILVGKGTPSFMWLVLHKLLTLTNILVGKGTPSFMWLVFSLNSLQKLAICIPLYNINIKLCFIKKSVEKIAIIIIDADTVNNIYAHQL